MTMNPARRMTWTVFIIGALAAAAAVIPFLLTEGPGPSEHLSVRGETVLLHGYGPYRHMPAEVAVQGLAQDLVTLVLGLPFLGFALVWARRGSRAGHLALTGAAAYLFVQYTMYLAMGTYNELFLLWVLLVLLTFQVLVRLLLAAPASNFKVSSDSNAARRFVGGLLVLNGVLIALLWLGVVIPPFLAGTHLPVGLAHFTTLIVQGLDLALFLPASVLSGYWYLRRKAAGDLLAPVYAVFLSLQMTALLAKLVWMAKLGAGGGPALVIIPTLLLAALVAAYLSLRPLR
ncbi:MAG: hypothetical protein M3Y59_02175 [Myxococcota bacterium]|nr:hypothetical protein [Myxococcota bacterium]